MTTDFLSSGWLIRLSLDVINPGVCFWKYLSPGIQGPWKRWLLGRQLWKEMCQMVCDTVVFWEPSGVSGTVWECFQGQEGIAVKWGTVQGAPACAPQASVTLIQASVTFQLDGTPASYLVCRPSNPAVQIWPFRWYMGQKWNALPRNPEIREMGLLYNSCKMRTWVICRSDRGSSVNVMSKCLK